MDASIALIRDVITSLQGYEDGHVVICRAQQRRCLFKNSAFDIASTLMWLDEYVDGFLEKRSTEDAETVRQILNIRVGLLSYTHERK